MAPNISLVDIYKQQQIIDIIEPFEILKENYSIKINYLLNIVSKIKIDKNKVFYLKDCANLLKNKKHNIHQISAKVLNKKNPILINFEKVNTYKTNTFFCKKIL